jgi:hypothetical protein
MRGPNYFKYKVIWRNADLPGRGPARLFFTSIGLSMGCLNPIKLRLKAKLAAGEPGI